MTELAKETKEDAEQKGVILFGVDLMRIECMRGSLINGYIGAAVGGLGGFLYTSKWKVTCHSAFGSFWAVAFTSWFFCRYKKYVRDKEWELYSGVVKKKQPLSDDEYHLPRDFTKDNENTEIKPENES